MVAPAKIGGLERVVCGLAAGHAARGHETHVVAVFTESFERHPFVQLCQDLGVRLVPMQVGRRRYFRERRQVAQILMKLQPDVVHSHSYRPDVIDAPVARRLGIPTVTTVHGFTGGPWKNRVYESVAQRAFRKFDAVVVVAAPIAERLVAGGVGAERIHVVRNAWVRTVKPLDRAAARRALGVGPGEFHIGWVGRMGREKGADIFIEALSKLEHIPFTASLVGDGPERPRLQRMAKRGKVAGRIHWHGRLDDAGRLFAAFDVFVLSSRTEGTPMALFEAMSCGVPVVATRAGGVPDVVSENEALLVPSEDPTALARAIGSVRADGAAASSRAIAARCRLESEFAVAPWLAAYERIYSSVHEGLACIRRCMS